MSPRFNARSKWTISDQTLTRVALVVLLGDHHIDRKWFDEWAQAFRMQFDSRSTLSIRCYCWSSPAAVQIHLVRELIWSYLFQTSISRAINVYIYIYVYVMYVGGRINSAQSLSSVAIAMWSWSFVHTSSYNVCYTTSGCSWASAMKNQPQHYLC